MATPLNTSAILFILRKLRTYKIIISLTLLSLILAAGTVIYLGQSLRILVDKGFTQSDPNFLNQALLGLILLIVLLSLASFARSYLSSWLGEKISQDIKTDVFKHLLYQSPNFYQTHSVGVLQSQLHNDSQLIQILLGGSASTGFRSLIQFWGAMIMLFISNLKLASIACMIMPMTLLPIVIFGKRVRHAAKIAQASEAETSDYSHEYLSHIQTIQAYNQQEQSLQKFEGQNTRTMEKTARRVWAQSVLSTSVIFLVFSAVSGLIWYGGHEVIAQRITAGEMISFIFYAVLAAGSINSITQVYGDWQRALSAATRFMDLLAIKPMIDNPSVARLLPEAIQGKINFHQVHFSYIPGGHKYVLEDFNLEIKKGETIAIVGPSGAGKSTVLNLLMRFFDPNQGTISIDNICIKDIHLSDLRRCIGWVPQEPALFKLSVYDNIRFSRPDATNEMVEKAAKDAYASEFITKLPHGFETILGADNINLSSGQRQRIAIARAILKDPSILLLDEATNSLDSESEFQIQKALDRTMKDRTTLIVAHRLTTVLDADRIIVMNHGKIVAMGTHTSLLRNNDIYQRFVELQFDREGKKTSPALKTI
ncbi:MAG: ATP-binding cassette domain-containing protein [Alphaproteobacteria bacterium]|nr:ATP-binding cassette domain-containing protein [Alphaproteobacteria bacterium]